MMHTQEIDFSPFEKYLNNFCYNLNKCNHLATIPLQSFYEHVAGPDMAFGFEFLFPLSFFNPHSLFLNTKYLQPLDDAHFAWHAKASPLKLLNGFPKFCPEYSTPFSKQSVAA